jgi:hypothetical protein
MDLSNPQTGIFALSWWRDTSYTHLFRLVQKQVTKGSAVLFFQSVLRGSNDKVVVTGKGTACDGTGEIQAEIQLLFKENIFTKDVKIVFHQSSNEKPRAVDLLKTIAESCRKETEMMLRKGK